MCVYAVRWRLKYLNSFIAILFYVYFYRNKNSVSVFRYAVFAVSSFKILLGDCYWLSLSLSSLLSAL